MANKTSQHILNTSATLLGFCLFVITSLHSNNYSSTSLIDDFTSVVSLFLIFSCLLSFYAIQTRDEVRYLKMEKVAEYLFGFALLGILTIIILLVFDIIN